MHFDTIIRNGTLVTAADIFNAEIGIIDGRIVALGQALGDATEVIDAKGLLVMPGGIDSHVHLAQPSAPGVIAADDFETGTRSAAMGGNTTLMPFCLQRKGENLRAALEAYRGLTKDSCYTDIGIHLIVSDASPQVLGQELPALFADGYTSFKIFMTYDDLKLNDREILDTLDVARDHGALVMVHAEGHDAIKFPDREVRARRQDRALLSRPLTPDAG